MGVGEGGVEERGRERSWGGREDMKEERKREGLGGIRREGRDRDREEGGRKGNILVSDKTLVCTWA